MRQGRISAAHRVPRKPFPIPILLRRIHLWVGLIIGFQMVVWAVSGTAMALLDMEAVAGRAPQPPALQPWPRQLAPPPIEEVEALTLRQLLGRPVYEARTPRGVHLLDAVSGAPVRIDANTAVAVTRQAWSDSAPVRSVELLPDGNLEVRDHGGPIWRINLEGQGSPSAYVQAETGQPLVRRTTTWRIWDFAWMLHNMDYSERKSFNHPLIVFAGFAALWVSLTGFYLIFKSFRRREFRWIVRD